jgi:hypothetical protein
MAKSRFAVSCSPGGDVFPSRSFLPAVPRLGEEGEPDAVGARSDPAVGDPGGLLKRRSGLGRRARLPAGAPGRGRSLHAFDPLLLVPREGRTLGSVQWFLCARSARAPRARILLTKPRRRPRNRKPAAQAGTPGCGFPVWPLPRAAHPIASGSGSPAARRVAGPGRPRSSPDHCRHHGALRPQAPSVRPAARSGPGPAPSPANGPTPGTEEAKRPRSRAAAEHDSTPTSRTLIVFRYSPAGKARHRSFHAKAEARRSLDGTNGNYDRAYRARLCRPPKTLFGPIRAGG